VSTGPPYLCKYRALASEQERSRTLDIIRNSEIWLDHTSSFNDPFELKFELQMSATRRQRLQRFKAGLKLLGLTPAAADRGAAELEAHFSSRPREILAREYRERLEAELPRQATLLCLSVRDDDNLMWAHYSDAHRGICLRFSVSAHHPFFARAQAVRYQTAYPNLNYFTSTNEERVKQTLLTKSEHWAYEAEYRVIEIGGKPGLYRFDPSLLAGVVLGARISDMDRDSVVAAVGGRAPIFQARLSRSQYRIEIHPL
jgi:hypothetical protein